MHPLNKKAISSNIKLLRESAGLTQYDFSSLLDISKRSVAILETEAGNSPIHTLTKILVFFKISFDELIKENLQISPNIRDQLLILHQNNQQVFNILSKKPPIAYAIKYKLHSGDFLNNAREVHEIKAYLNTFGLSYLAASISNGLKRVPELIEIKPHEKKKNRHVYLKNKTEANNNL